MWCVYVFIEKTGLKKVEKNEDRKNRYIVKLQIMNLGAENRRKNCVCVNKVRIRVLLSIQ